LEDESPTTSRLKLTNYFASLLLCKSISLYDLSHKFTPIFTET
jgi:hypothetical protein